MHNTRARYAAHAVAEIWQDFISCDSFVSLTRFCERFGAPVSPLPRPVREPVNSIVRNRITRAVRLIFRSSTLPHRILSSSTPRDYRARAFSSLFFLFLVYHRHRRRTPRPGTCRGPYARTRIFVITRPGEPRVFLPLFTPPRNFYFVDVTREEILHLHFSIVFEYLDISARLHISIISLPSHLCIRQCTNMT